MLLNLKINKISKYWTMNFVVREVFCISVLKKSLCNANTRIVISSVYVKMMFQQLTKWVKGSPCRIHQSQSMNMRSVRVLGQCLATCTAADFWNEINNCLLIHVPVKTKWSPICKKISLLSNKTFIKSSQKNNTIWKQMWKYCKSYRAVKDYFIILWELRLCSQ